MEARVREDAAGAEPQREVLPARGVVRPELATLPHTIGNAAMGRLLRSIAPAMVARDLREMNAPAEREIGPNQRPPGAAFFQIDGQVKMEVPLGGRAMLRPAAFKALHLGLGPQHFFRVLRAKFGFAEMPKNGPLA